MRNVRPTSRARGSTHETEPDEPTPLSGAGISAWSIDPQRRRRYLQVAFAFGALAVAIVVLYLLRDFLGAFVLGAAIAFLIQPGVVRLTDIGLPRVLAIIVMFVVIIVALAGLVLLVVPLGVNEVGQLQRQAPALAAAAQDRINSLQGSPIEIFGFKIDLRGTTETINAHLREYLLGQFGNAVSIGLTALTTLLQLVLTFIVAFLLALQAASIKRVLRRFVPSDYRTDFDQIWRRIRIAGIAALVPYIGPFLGAVPAILVGLAGSPTKALLIAIAYFLISNVILNFVYPKVVGDAVRLPAILVIVAFIAGFSWAGILGMFVAVPIAATLRILFDHIYPRLYGKPA